MSKYIMIPWEDDDQNCRRRTSWRRRRSIPDLNDEQSAAQNMVAMNSES